MDKIRFDDQPWDENMPSPAWHGEVLAEREAALVRGEEEILDWKVAKARIRKETS
jgi:hypothetical protein